jgi:dipeptide/tripeptide permease
MAINVGSLFAPTTAIGIKNYAMNELGFSSNDAYHFSFMVACAALILSIAIYYVFRGTFRHVEGGKRAGAQAAQVEDNLTPEETKKRIVALCLVFAVVIFFWMAFHQNGLTLTYFADEFTATNAFGFDTMLFNVWNLALLIVAVYATFSIFQSEGAKGKLISGAIATLVLGFLVYRTMGIEPNAEIAVAAPIFQQFNPFYVVALTPVSMAIFGSLARKGKEPSAPRKIAFGMLVAAIGFAIMAFGSQGLNTPNEQQRAIAFNKAEAFAAKCYAVAPNVDALKEADGKANADIKAAQDFMGKLNDKTRPVFTDVYNATCVIAAAEAANEVVEETAVVEEPVVVEEATEVVETPVVEETEVAAEVVEAPEVVEVVETASTEVAEAEATLAAIKAETKEEKRTSPYWLIFTYLVLTFAELLLSPMGISFVSKVAPPKLKGLMMGGWFVATAIGNMLVAVGGFLWAGLPLWSVWAVFIALCLISALFMFAMMKRLESATK